jgi:(1->4)-alpha-D-glucan 1-alpha-D-glucosylmutase
MLDALRPRIPAEGTGASNLSGLCAELLEHWRDGRVKLYLTHRALTLRRRRSRLFGAGEYRGLAPGGRHAEHVVALARVDGPDAVVAAVPRLTARLAGLTGRFALGEDAWEHTWVALGDDRLAGVYRDRFSGLTVASEHRDGIAVLPVPALFAHFPVAFLERESGLP